MTSQAINTLEAMGKKALQMTRKIELPTGSMQLNFDQSTFELDELIGFGARANAKRGFLFVSKVLGKHWPVTPQKMLNIHVDLASKIPADMPEPIVFIAMAETGIGLGQGVFESFKRMHPLKDVLFIHTSRYHIKDADIIEFEESHSHAPRQFLHQPNTPDLRNLLAHAKSLVLIDDEASTGNTFFNLTAACRAWNPLIKHVHLGAITNFMGQSTTVGLTERFGLDVTIGASLSGQYEFTPGQLVPASGTAQSFEHHTDRGASSLFGRLGITHALKPPVNLAADLYSEMDPDERILVLGTGEFMHMAFLLGQSLEALGVDVKVQSTTRSPILQWGAISSVISFPDNYGEGIQNFIYNVLQGQYHRVFICHETPVNDALVELAKKVGGRLFHFASEDNIQEGKQ